MADRRGVMIKIITKEWLKKYGACDESIDAWGKESDHDTVTTLNRLIDRGHYDWAGWLIVRLMTKRQNVMYAIYSAEQVVELYEKKCREDDRPRKAIDAAKRYVARPSKATISDAYAAAHAATYAACAAAHDAAAATHAAYAAAHAAYAAAHAAYAADAATHAACAATDSNENRNKMWHRILHYGISLIQNQGGK